MSPTQMKLNNYREMPDGTWQRTVAFGNRFVAITRDAAGKLIRGIESDPDTGALPQRAAGFQPADQSQNCQQDAGSTLATDREIELYQLAIRDLIAERDWPRVVKVADQLANRARQLAR